jgi:hypothetical protein
MGSILCDAGWSRPDNARFRYFGIRQVRQVIQGKQAFQMTRWPRKGQLMR